MINVLILVSEMKLQSMQGSQT